MGAKHYDIVFLGGGLAATLAAYRLRQSRPDCRLLILEQGDRLGGDHIWSFHATDVTAEAAVWLEPFVEKSWSGQSVSFPQLSRHLDTGYRSITSARLHAVAMQLLADGVRTGAQVASVEADGVTLAGGEQIGARCIIDCRGAVRDDALQIGYQKFLGREIETPTPHGVSEPVIMDATVPQHDGYRFVYLLPFSERHLLIEDTYYSDDGQLDEEGIGCRIDAFQIRRGWEAARTLRQERGILPIALGGDIDRFWRNRRSEGPCASAGLRAALFHPTTGYSLPDAVRVADMLARQAPLETAAVRQMIEDHSRRLWRARRFYRMLNRMLFLSADPDERWRVLERFYGLPAGLIERFYGDRLTALDKARILIGRPPVPVGRALRALPENALRERTASPAYRQDTLRS